MLGLYINGVSYILYKIYYQTVYYLYAIYEFK